MNETMTFQELCDWYFDTIAPVVLKPNIREGRERDFKNHLLPTLGTLTLREVTPMVLDSLFRNLSEDGNKRRFYRLKEAWLGDRKERKQLSRGTVSETTFYAARQGEAVEEETAERIAAENGIEKDALFLEVTAKHGLSGASINKLKQELSAVFSAAVKKEVVERNPCARTTIPRIDTVSGVYLEEKECRIFVSLLRKQEDRQFELMMLILLTTGIRSGELLALYWEDVSLDTGLFEIRGTLVREKGVWVKQTPKTPDSCRSIYLPEEVFRLFRRHRKIQLENRMRLGSAWADPRLIFTNRQGGPLTNAYLNKRLKALVQESALPKNLHLHSLRHTYASLLINAGVTPRVVADRLGHASVRTTLDIYSHIFRQTEQDTVETISRAVFP